VSGISLIYIYIYIYIHPAIIAASVQNGDSWPPPENAVIISFL
jgi:hypothetical protein